MALGWFWLFLESRTLGGLMARQCKLGYFQVSIQGALHLKS